MHTANRLGILIISTLVVLATTTSLRKASAAGMVVENRTMINSAMSAAPESIAKSAKIVTFDSKGKVKTLREGGNGWTCIPDNPDTPGNDPMCVDPNGWKWVMAYTSHQTPAVVIGFGYMLKGGSDASNTDPYATKPANGMKWVTTGPHIMIFGSAVKGINGYVSGASPNTKRPYVMWAGTPYEHLMIPVD